MNTFGDFIAEHVDVIVDDFEAFARTAGSAAANLSVQDLRDHAKVVLEAVAADMGRAQTAHAQQQKSLGKAERGLFPQIQRTSQLHAQHRFDQGFSLPEMLSEYRALRASVIRRWTEQLHGADAEQLAELTRFGEAIDEGLTEAIAWYSKRLEDSRNLLIGVLAHDLRGPLSAVRMSADYLLRADRLQDSDLRAANRIVGSAKRMAGYIDDILDFTQTLLGAGLIIARQEVDLAALCEDVAEELRAAHPNATVQVEVPGRLTGQWDGGRLSQLVSNLVINAIIHGAPARPVTLTLAESEGQATLAVHNEGTPIPEEKLPRLFQPLMQPRPGAERRHGSSGLGLGLHIAREIALAHGGTIRVESTAESGTTVTVRLPPA